MHAKTAKAAEPFVPLAQRPGFLVRRLNQIHYAIFLEECGDFDITPVQYGMLTVLLTRPGLDQKALGHELGLDRTNTADVLKRLESRGLVRREQSALDARAKQAYLTTDGRKVARAMYRSMIAAQERMLAPLPPADRKRFLELVRILVDANNEFGRASMRSL